MPQVYNGPIVYKWHVVIFLMYTNILRVCKLLTKSHNGRILAKWDYKKRLRYLYVRLTFVEVAKKAYIPGMYEKSID